jgi:hypothetical protein
MKRGVVLVLLSLPLAGCLADQKQQIAACKLEATRLYPNEVPPLSDKLNTYVRTCMEAHGYEYDAVQKKCKKATWEWVPMLIATSLLRGLAG